MYPSVAVEDSLLQASLFLGKLHLSRLALFFFKFMISTFYFGISRACSSVWRQGELVED